MKKQLRNILPLDEIHHGLLAGMLPSNISASRFKNISPNNLLGITALKRKVNKGIGLTAFRNLTNSNYIMRKVKSRPPFKIYGNDTLTHFRQMAFRTPLGMFQGGRGGGGSGSGAGRVSSNYVPKLRKRGSIGAANLLDRNRRQSGAGSFKARMGSGIRGHGTNWNRPPKI